MVAVKAEVESASLPSSIDHNNMTVGGQSVSVASGFCHGNEQNGKCRNRVLTTSCQAKEENMIATRHLSICLKASLALLSTLILLGFSPASAATSAWQEVLGGKVRLVAGGTEGGKIKAGLEIVMDEGWKTYWKVPGDAGIPPFFEFSNSRNIADLEIKWPVPTRFGTKSQMLGYKEAIIFPFLITPEDANSSTVLNVDVQLGICDELCVPMAGSFSLPIAMGGEADSLSEMLIDRDLALVPLAQRPGFSINEIKLEKRTDAPDHVILSVAIPEGYGKRDLFIEAPEGWFVPLPQPAERTSDNNELHFELELSGLPKKARIPGAELVVTLTNGEEAIEQRVTIPE